MAVRRPERRLVAVQRGERPRLVVGVGGRRVLLPGPRSEPAREPLAVAGAAVIGHRIKVETRDVARVVEGGITHAHRVPTVTRVRVQVAPIDPVHGRLTEDHHRIATRLQQPVPCVRLDTDQAGVPRGERDGGIPATVVHAHRRGQLDVALHHAQRDVVAVRGHRVCVGVDNRHVQHRRLAGDEGRRPRDHQLPRRRAPRDERRTILQQLVRPAAVAVDGHEDRLRRGVDDGCAHAPAASGRVAVYDVDGVAGRERPLLHRHPHDEDVALAPPVYAAPVRLDEKVGRLVLDLGEEAHVQPRCAGRDVMVVRRIRRLQPFRGVALGRVPRVRELHADGPAPRQPAGSDLVRDGPGAEVPGDAERGLDAHRFGLGRYRQHEGNRTERQHPQRNRSQAHGSTPFDGAIMHAGSAPGKLFRFRGGPGPLRAARAVRYLG